MKVTIGSKFSMSLCAVLTAFSVISFSSHGSAFDSQQLNALEVKFATQLHDIKGVSVTTLDSKVLVKGEVSSPRELNRIRRLVEQHSDYVGSTVSISLSAMQSIVKSIVKDINDPNIDVRAGENQIVMEGKTDSSEAKERAEIIAKLYLPGLSTYTKDSAILNLITVTHDTKGER